MHELFVKIYKTSALDTLHQPFIRSKELCDSVYETFKHFWKTKECNGIGLLFLILMDKVMEEKYKLWDSNF